MEHIPNPGSSADASLAAEIAACRESEERYRRLIALLPAAVYVCEAPSGVITFFNDSAARLWGRRPQVGDTDERFCGSLRLFRPDGRELPHDRTPMAVALTEGRSFRNEEVIIEQPDGNRVSVRVSIDPIRDGAGRITGAVNVFQDATALERAEADLRASERRFRDMIDALPAAVYTTDADGRLTHFNPAAVEFFGRQPELGTDRWCVSSRLFRPDGSPLAPDECPMAVALRQDRALHGEEGMAERPDGTRVWFAAYPQPLHDAEGRVVGGINMLVDITGRKHAEQAQARLAAIVECSDDAIIAKDLAGNISNWNAGAERLYGYTAAEAIGRPITMLIPPERHHEEEMILERVRRGERIQHYETVRLRRDGTRLDVSLSVSPIVDARGRIVGASKIARDITAQKAAERARVEEALLRETLARVGSMLTSELDERKVALAITEAGTTLTAADWGAFLRRTGNPGEDLQLYSTSGAVPRPLSMVADPRVAARLRPALTGESAVRIDDLEGERQAGAAAGEAPPIRSCLAIPVISRSGEVLGTLVFTHARAHHFTARHQQLAQGITSSAAVALDNAQLYEHAQEVNRVKDEFLATLSHELRTPLNAMLGWSHMLRSATLPADTQRRAIESLERNARAQAQLVEDLLDVSRIVTGKLQLASEEVDLTRLVMEAVDSVRPAAIAKGLDLQAELDHGLAVIVRGDPDRLRQVVWNLLSNATKFTPPGGQIHVELAAADAKAQVIVRDTGQGIPAHFLRHVFERFRQAESSTSRRHGGLGLGLAIVRHLTEAHGGTVSADSAGEGRGSTFTITLPACALGDRLDAPPAAHRPVSSTLGGLHVLVVDDQADARDLARTVLEMHGAEVTTVASAGEALHALARQRFHVLVADIGMPEQDGYSLIHAVRALPPEQGGSLPAIAATAYASLRERARALEAGYGWHLAKPLDPEQLVAAVAAASSQRAATSRPDHSRLAGANLRLR